jgi:hypothetical protein
MKEFTLAEFAAHLEGLAAGMKAVEATILEEAGKTIEALAKAKIGEYQEAAGPFATWEPLSENTLYCGVDEEGHRYPGKVELGYAPPDNPLLRTGEMRDSIEHQVIGNEVHVGSNSDVAVDQELGTTKIPPRRLLGGAAFEQAPKIAEAAGMAIAMHLRGEKPKA